MLINQHLFIWTRYKKNKLNSILTIYDINGILISKIYRWWWFQCRIGSTDLKTTL